MKKKKCHNCEQGIVDGGSKKRINKELNQLQDKKQKMLSQIKEKNMEKLLKIKQALDDEYNPLIIKKSDEIPKRLGKCFYCKGFGIRN